MPQKKNLKKRLTDNRKFAFDFSSPLINIALLAISGFLFYQAFRSIEISNQKSDIYEQAIEDVNTLRIKNLELLTESMAISQDYYVEIEGRDRLNLSRPGEYSFIISQELLEGRQLGDFYDTYVEKSDVVALPIGISAWKRFLMNEL